MLHSKTKVYKSRNNFLKVYFYFSIQDLGGYKRGLGGAPCWLSQQSTGSFLPLFIERERP